MKQIVVSIPNSLLSGGLSLYLRQEPDFHVLQDEGAARIVETCVMAKADVLLAEARHYSPYTVRDWLTRFQELKLALPHCKLALVVDENTSPQVAEEVKQARSYGLIDAFFYGTVSGEYVTAVIGSL